MFKNRSLIKMLAFVLLCGFILTAVPALEADAAAKPKYVFYMIGDGLGASQRQAAEFFLREQNGDSNAKLVMNTFPVTGINTTYSSDTLVTDSAAAGTALATGYKTNNGLISKLPDGTNLKTLIECAEDKGMATGLVSTTRITHATPAVFASHNISRDNENEIAADYLDSGVDFIAGGGYRHFVPQDWEWGSSKRKDDRNILQEFHDKGYKVFVTDVDTESFRNYKPTGEKVIALFNSSHEPYEIDRTTTDKNPSIAEMTDKAIQALSKDKDGFFLMVEGGRIDHACHANDATGSIQDTLAFDDAVAKAYEFYKKHPSQTLIVIAGDHETGGMGLGFSTNYFLNMDQLLEVKVSVEDVLQKIYTGDRAAFYSYIENNLGLDNLTAVEKAEIEKAMDIKDAGTDITAYGSYEPVAIAATHIVSERANLFWTTYAHSATAIPLTAIGTGANSFGGYKDNTEIAQAMADVLGFQLSK